MRKLSLCIVTLSAVLIAGCEEGPEQIYKPNPPTCTSGTTSQCFDARQLNGWKPLGYAASGTQPFAVGTSGQKTGTVKICEADELATRWAKMVKAAIIPTTGMGGLDMKGTPKWSGLTIDQAQQTLCQAYVADDGMYYWGDNDELIAFFDTKTRLIDSLGAFPGYEGKLTAGTYELAVNLEIMKDGKALTDATSDANVRAMNQAFLKAFRTEVANPDQRDCIALSTCYVTDWNTMKLFVFLDLGLYVAVEPKASKIYTIQLALQRNFEFTKGNVTFEAPTMPPIGLPPTPKVSYQTSCRPTLGLTWDHIRQNCLGIDPEEKALTQPVWSNEALVADMGGLGVYLVRPSLAADQILPDSAKPQPTDQIVGLGFTQLYEGQLMLSRTDLYAAFFTTLAAQITALYPTIDLSTTFAKITPLEIKAGDAASLTIGTQRVKDCSVTPCTETTLTIRARAIVEAAVKAEVGTVPDALKDPNYYVEILLREMLKIFNDGKAPTATELYMFFGDDTAQVMYGRLARKFAGARHSVTVAFHNKSDQLLTLFFKTGALRTENVLFRDAELTNTDGVFRLWNLAKSPRIGLAKVLFPKTVNIATQNAVVTLPLDPTTDVLAAYHKEDSLSGYSTPIEGQHDLFNPAAYFGFSGNVVGAALHASGKDGIIKSVASGAFYDKLDFCGVKVGLFDSVDALIKALPSTCDDILNYSENGKTLVAMSTIVQTTPFKIGLRLFFTAGRVDSARYWAEQ
jgi:hypothetical protein